MFVHEHHKIIMGCGSSSQAVVVDQNQNLPPAQPPAKQPPPQVQPGVQSIYIVFVNVHYFFFKKINFIGQ